MGLKVTRIAPVDVLKRYAAGNWKDIKALDELIRESGAELVPIEFDEQRRQETFEQVPAGCSDIILHYSFWPELLPVLRARFPSVRIHTRVHNAEAFQHFHRSAPGWLPTKANARGWYGCFNLWRRDSQCKQGSDSLLCISEWDRRNYFRFMPGPAALVDVPYHCPWPTLRPSVRARAWSDRDDIVICLAGGNDRIGRSQRENFARFVSEIRRRKSQSAWRFQMSSGVFPSTETPGELDGIESLTDLSEPWDVLCRVKIVALLTPLGFGSKTTIVDALAAGCNVIADTVLMERLPREVRRHCLAVDMNKPQSFPEILLKAREEPPSRSLNENIRKAAAAGLNLALRGTSMR